MNKSVIFLGNYAIHTYSEDGKDITSAIAVSPKTEKMMKFFDTVSRFERGAKIPGYELRLDNTHFVNTSILVSFNRDEFDIFYSQQELVDFICSTKKEVNLYPYHL